MTGMTYRPLIELLPPEYRKVLEFQRITTAEESVIATLRDEIQKVLDRQFPEDSDAVGIARYEYIFGITPKDTDTLADRKKVVLNQFKTQLPYTIRRLDEMMKAICGEGNYSLAIQNIYTLRVDAELDSEAQYDALEQLIERVKPANLLALYVFKYFTITQVQGLTIAQMNASIIEKFSGGV